MQNAVTEARQSVTIVNRKGLHARASAKLSKLASEYQSKVVASHEGQEADARSIMDLLMLVAAQGCEVEPPANGPDAAEAVTAIASLIADGFGERGESDVLY